MDEKVGRVASQTGSREPSPEGLGPAGFDPSRGAELAARLRDFEEMAGSWDEVSAAANVVECALPSQMSAAIARLIAARRVMDATMRQVGLRLVRRPLAGCDSDGSPKGEKPQALSAQHDSAGPQGHRP
jgi:hypothetical protein